MKSVTKKPFSWMGQILANPKSNAKSFTESRTARLWMSTLALSRKMEGSVMLAELRDAYQRTADLFRSGHIYLDYQPQDEQCFEMPSIDDACYMQALMYWTVRFDCTPENLVEAYARLGRGAPVRVAQVLIRSITKDEKKLAGWLRTTCPPALFSPTVPLYEATKPSPL